MGLTFDINGNASGFFQVMNAVKTHASHAVKEIDSEVTKSWKGVGKGFIGGIAGALSFETVKASLEGFLDKAKEIRDLSEQMDMGADATQRWQKAADGLGLSFGGMQSVLTAIAQKRQEALSDPKAADIFQRLGMDRKTVTDTKNINESDFAQMVLKAGQASDEMRSTVGEIVGRRGLKYLPTGEEFNRKTANISDDDMRVAQMSEEAGKKIKGAIAKFWSGLITGAAQYYGEFKHGDDPENFRVAALPMTRKTPRKKGESSEPDEAMEKNAAKAADRAERSLDQESRIEAAKRQNMTAAEKRISEEKELESVRERLGKLSRQEAPKYLQQKGREDELAEWQNKQRDKIADLTVREQGLMADLNGRDKDRRVPMAFGDDSLAKSGLFNSLVSPNSGGSDMKHEEMRNQREILTELRGINRNTKGGGHELKW